nr:TniQ family protein [Shinella curvata]
MSLKARAHEGETVASFCSRTAALHGAENASDFWSLFGLNFGELTKGASNALGALQRLLGPDLHVNRRGTCQSGADLAVRGHRLAARFVSLAQDRVCALCLADDEQNLFGRPGNRAFARLNWLPKFLRACPVHHVELVELPRIDWHLGPDFALRLRREPGGIEGLCARSSSRAETNFERYARERLEWNLPTQPSWLDSVPLQAAAHLCELVGAEIQGPNRDWPAASDRELCSAADVGFEHLLAGVQEFERVLAEQMSKNFRSKRRHCPTSIFGRFAAEALQFADYPGYAEVLSIMRDVGVKHLALGPGDEFLGAVTKRQYHSVSSASREYGVPASSLRTVLEELGKLPAAGTTAKSNLACEQEVFEVRFMEHIVDMVRDRRINDSQEDAYVTALEAFSAVYSTAPSGHISAPDASVRLRVSENTVSALAHEGFLREVFPSQSATVAQYAKLELRRFSDRYLPERELAGFAKKLGGRVTNDALKRGLKVQIPKWRVGENFYLRDDVEMLLTSKK